MASVLSSPAILIIFLPISIIAAIVLGILAACKKVRKVFLFIPLGVGIFSILAFFVFTMDKFMPDTLFGDNGDRGPGIPGSSGLEYVVSQTDTWDGTSDTSWYQAGASELYIDTAEKFAGLSALSSSGKTFSGVKISIRVNMDLCGKEWDPINDFEGEIYGNGAVISNFVIKSSAGTYWHGLFAKQSGTVNNLHLREFTVNGKLNTGSFAGFNSGTIVNCTANGEVKATKSFTDMDGGYAVYCGGIAGNNYGTIKNCSFNGEVSSTASSQYFNVTVKSYCGGIAAYNSGTIDLSYSLGKVTATSKGSNNKVGCYSYSGGVCAFLGGTVKNSFAGGEVKVVVDAHKYGYDTGIASGGVYGIRSANGVLENSYVLDGQIKDVVYIDDAGTLLTTDPAPTLSLSEIESRLGKTFSIK